MPALVIESFPEALHAKLQKIAAAHSRSITQETIHIIETAIVAEEKAAPAASSGPEKSYWANRKLLPEYEPPSSRDSFRVTMIAPSDSRKNATRDETALF